MSPTPNTTFIRDAARCGHFRQTMARARNSAIAASLASRPGAVNSDAEGAALSFGVEAGDETGEMAMVSFGCGRGAPSVATVSGDTEMNLTPRVFSPSRC